MMCLESAGRLPLADYRRATLYTTLSPCAMCAGAVLHYQIPRCVIADTEHFQGEEMLLQTRGVEVMALDFPDAKVLVRESIELHPELWAEDTGMEVGVPTALPPQAAQARPPLPPPSPAPYALPPATTPPPPPSYSAAPASDAPPSNYAPSPVPPSEVALSEAGDMETSSIAPSAATGLQFGAYGSSGAPAPSVADDDGAASVAGSDLSYVPPPGSVVESEAPAPSVAASDA